MRVEFRGAATWPLLRCALIAFAVACATLTGGGRIAVAAVESPSTIGSLVLVPVAAAPPLDPAGDATLFAPEHVSLGWDVQHERASSEVTTARLATDGKFIYARFDSEQRETLLQSQHSNNVGDGTDDEVSLDLWPSGNKGFSYQFSATSNGTHYQYSSENTAYEPTWESLGKARDHGYTVTMKIPVDVMRGTGNTADWKVQFERVVRATGEHQIWSYSPAQSNASDVTFAGSLAGVVAAAGAKAKPRVGVYGLAEAGSKRSGLSTSRVGSDFSIPITPSASFFGTVHPDFSNVEVDQQTISPTAFQRFYTEVRPFFTQADNYFDNFDCDACPSIGNLYTPNIPAPHDAFAAAGHQGRLQFAAFDALGTGRSDAAESLGYTTPDNHWRYFMERVSANCTEQPGTSCQFGDATVHDDVFANGLSYNDGKHVDAYFDYGSDSGSTVLVPNRAQRYDTGTFLYGTTSGVAFSTRKIGEFYDPADGFIQHPDIAGYGLYGVKFWTFSGNSKINSIGVSSFIDRYRNHLGTLDQSDTSYVLDVLTKSRIDVNVSVGSNYLLQNFSCTPPSCVLASISQNGVGATYHAGTSNAPGNFPYHGSSSTPTTVTFNTGRFGPGRLDSWTRGTTMIAGARGTISLEADDTRQYLDSGRTNVQWLERLGYTLAASSNATFSLGVRRIIGTPPDVFAAAPVSCTTVVTLSQLKGVAPCTGAWNLSFAFHHRSPHDDLYFGYGDASQLSTTPSFIFKLIHYIGAEKGT